MDGPCGRSRRAETVLATVETSPGSGVFEVDERLRVEQVDLRSDATMSTARLVVRLDSDFDTAAARARYQPDRRIVVRIDAEQPVDRAVLFEGFPPVQEARWRGGPGRGEESFGFVASHVYEQLSRDRRSWIYGRQMRSGEIADGMAVDATTWGARSLLVDALPCVFNPRSVANRAATPLTAVGSDDASRRIDLFTYDGDPNAGSWTCAQALRYLVWFYAPREGPVDINGLLDATDAMVGGGDPSAGSSAGLAERLMATCDSLVCDATNLIEALSLLADAAGVHVTVDSTARGSSLRVWAVGDRPRRQLHLARGGFHPDGKPRYDASALRASDVFRANEISEAVIRWDYRRIVNAPIVLGDVKAYEMTVPLVPGWKPTANLDNVSAGGRTAAKDLALTPEQAAALADTAAQDPWFQKHHREGSQFAENRYVARRWVLNEDGRFDGPTFNRNAPFDDYQPFDFSTVADATVTRRGRWSRRSRPLLPTITRTELGARLGVVVEVSFDGGASWHAPQGAISVLRDPSAIVFEVTNPTQITPPGVDPAQQNLWYAIIDQTFRVRVTAVVAGDERLAALPAVDESSSPTLVTTSRVIVRPEAFRFTTRDGTTNVLASVNADATDIDRDDSAALKQFASTIARRGQDRRVIASPVVPWLEQTIAIGDEIERIRGRGVSFLTREDGATVGPVVVGKTFRFERGRWSTSLLMEHSDEASMTVGSL